LFKIVDRLSVYASGWRTETGPHSSKSIPLGIVTVCHFKPWSFFHPVNAYTQSGSILYYLYTLLYKQFLFVCTVLYKQFLFVYTGEFAVDLTQHSAHGSNGALRRLRAQVRIGLN